MVDFDPQALRSKNKRTFSVQVNILTHKRLHRVQERVICVSGGMKQC